MQNEQQKKTAFESSAATDEKQPLINSNNIITDEDDFCNSDDLFAEFREVSFLINHMILSSR